MAENDELYLNDIFALLGEGSVDEYKRMQKYGETKSLEQLHRVLINEDGQYVLIDGDVGPFTSLKNKDDLKDIFEQNISFKRFENGLVMCRKSPPIDEVDLRELIYLNQDIIQHAIQELQPVGNITTAEYGLLIDLLAGLSTKESAVKDNASYHTRRNQVKSLLDKMSVNSQTDLIRNVMAAIFSPTPNKNKNNELKLESNDPAIKHFDELLKSNYRFHKINISTNETLRVLDFGPITGKPIILCHSSLSPFLPNTSLDWLYENNVRVLMPLRPGYLEKMDTIYDSEEYIEKSANALAHLFNIFSLQNVTIMSAGTGAPHALEFCHSHSDRINKLVIISTTYSELNDVNGARKLRNGLLAIPKINFFIINKVLDFYLYKLRDPDKALEVFLHDVKGCENDENVFKSIFGRYNAHELYYYFMKQSVVSIAMTMMISDQRAWKYAPQIRCPVVFVHGSQNIIDKPVNVKAIANKFQNSIFIELPDKGQFISEENIQGFLKFALADFEDLREMT